MQETVAIQETMAAFPIWVLALDYILGVVMWTLIGRAAMSIFLPEDSSFFFMRFFVRATNPILKFFRPITPRFLLEPLVPIYVAWFFFMIRFYLMPWLLGYSVMGMLSFPLESEISAVLYKMFGGS
ncbi:YggT family protein [Nitratireductor aquimarinus]|uniref:YggT family protein n=1 Tax=Nitratireductor aquimarinus TaxID=889300 RepID=A0ABU4AKU8_9HYPH|nr:MULTISPECIES: YggT family protein [Alphaproteobacteria]MBY5999056.1 YggT family protein [Tritonibacter mobilis]MCA1304763.1 YggT family protein [Nitratireductor aquimarinus]MDJ1465010.1 YggT family protein [Nitratireductor sp. GZWM139]MDV2965474.1 YggT family protein [Nitratireductor aquimarinus]MDV6226887.1 YggT family protein [Nitratireductor aquimarinus]